MEEIKQVPYGIADFVAVRERNLYYVDKTLYLSLLEQQPDNLFYIRLDQSRHFPQSAVLLRYADHKGYVWQETDTLHS